MKGWAQHDYNRNKTRCRPRNSRKEKYGRRRRGADRRGRQDERARIMAKMKLKKSGAVMAE